MVKRSLLQKKKQLVVKRKQLRRAQNQMVLHSTATGWWSLSLRVASRTGLMWRYGAVSPLPAQSAVKLWVGCSHPMCLVHSAVRDRGSEGSAGSDWVLGRCPQLSGRATKLKPWNRHKIFFLPALCKLCFFLMWYCWYAGAQFYEADERRAVGVLLSQQLQGARYSRTHASKSLSCPADDVKLHPGLDVRLYFLFSRLWRRRTWTTLSLIRKMSILMPAVKQTTPSGAW